jgi:hypothetical protein
MISNYGEEITHSYFGLSDADTVSTHFPYSNRRDKYEKYDSVRNLRYYENSTFVYENTEQDLVISSTEELQDMFDYMLVENRGAMEIVIDSDYMVSQYERVHGAGSYKANGNREETYTTILGRQYLESVYDPRTDIFTYYEWEVSIVGNKVVANKTELVYYNYKLRSTFAQQTMKPNKFQEQYIFIADDDEEFVYSNSGKKGLLYVLTQNLLLDSDGEIEHLVNYLDEKDVYGTYNLYVKDSILNAGTGATYLAKLESLFNEYLADSGLTIQFNFKASNHRIDDSLTASIYEMVVTEKVA